MGQSELLNKARDFIYRNGRLLDRKRFEYLFEGGSNEEVLKALRAYQNADGGFGNALEPDIRCPSSQPAATEMALLIMDEIQCFDQEIVKGIVHYVKQITLNNGGLPLAFCSIMAYPHAPWWDTEREDVPSINPTGRIIGMLLKQNVWTSFMQEEWFISNVDFIWRYMEKGEPTGYHDGIQWMTFLQHIPDRSRASSHLSKVDKWLQNPGTIERNVHAGGYVHKVLDWAPTPDSYANKFVSEAELAEHLRFLIEQQKEDGGWPISWPAVSPLSELEWRGWVTVERLMTLKTYGRL